MRLFFLSLLLIFALNVVSKGWCVRVVTVPCGGTLPIDSQCNLDPTWSLSPYRERMMRLSGGALSFSKRSIGTPAKSLIVSESGMTLDSVTLLEVAPNTSESSSGSSSSLTTSVCSATLNPLVGGMDGVVSVSARFTVVQALASDGGTCASPVTIQMTSSDNQSTASLVFNGIQAPFTSSVAFAASGEAMWPMTLSFHSQCALQFLLLVDRHGTIHAWYVWIPTTIYTACIVALFLPMVFLRRRLSVATAGVYLFLVFLGFLGSCIGLVVELLQWQSSLGRLFPFPPAVTLYSCLSVFYALLLVPVLYRQGYNSILLLGAGRLLIYGLNCALCVGYWLAGYVVLGSLAVFQLFLTNVVLTWYYAYVTVYLRRAVRRGSSLPKFSNNFLYLWFAPVTPFACCALMYYDLFLLTSHNVRRDVDAIRMHEVVRVYTAQMSLPLLFLQNIYGVALLAVAVAYHMTLLVLLFVALLLWILHTVYAIDQYCQEWRRWRHRYGPLSTGDCLSLSVIMDALLFNGERYPEAPQPIPQHIMQSSGSPPTSVRLRGRAEQYQRDVAAARGNMDSRSASPCSDSYSSARHQTPSQHSQDRSRGFTTPQRQTMQEVLEYWPSSVER